jgi:glycosyltransferase involved in cell wall biosynthesis
MTGPLVSIVLPTHNGARFLDEALASWIGQTYRRWELVAVDDGSQDETPGRLAAWADRDARVRLVRHPVNRGLPAALNTGFAQAGGAYLTWTSDDNCARPAALAEMVRFLEERPEVDMVYTDHTLIDEAGREIGRVEVREPGLLGVMNCIGASFLYRRRVHETVGAYAEEFALAEDYDFWLRTSTRFHLAPLHRDLYLYRVHEQSLSARHHERARVAFDRVLASRLPTLGWLDAPGKADALIGLAARAAARGERLRAAACLGRAFRHCPSFILAWLTRRAAGMGPGGARG